LLRIVVCRLGPRGIVVGGDKDILPLLFKVEDFFIAGLLAPTDLLLMSIFSCFLATLLHMKAI